MRPTTPSRWLRAAVLGISAVGLATVGHVVGGGHVEPVFVGLLIVAATLGGYGWLGRERGLIAITAVVLGTQIAAHVVLAVGHQHTMSEQMLITHAGAAVVLAVFLAVGEARLHAAARRRFLQWLVAVRIAVAGLPRELPWTARVNRSVRPLFSLWAHGFGDGRGPPVACAA